MKSVSKVAIIIGLYSITNFHKILESAETATGFFIVSLVMSIWIYCIVKFSFTVYARDRDVKIGGWKAMIFLLCLWYLGFIVLNTFSISEFGLSPISVLLVSIVPAVFMTLFPHLITKSGQEYWQDIKEHTKYFLFASFGYWDNQGVTRKLLKIDDMVNELQKDTHIGAEENVDNLDIIEKYNNVISTTIGTRVLLLAFFNIFTPLALYVRYTAPFPLLVYDKDLLRKLPDLWICNPWQKAYDRYAKKYKNYKDMKVTDIKWLVMLKGFVIFFEESRCIQWFRRYHYQYYHHHYHHHYYYHQ